MASAPPPSTSPGGSSRPNDHRRAPLLIASIAAVLAAIAGVSAHLASESLPAADAVLSNIVASMKPREGARIEQGTTDTTFHTAADIDRIALAKLGPLPEPMDAKSLEAAKKTLAEAQQIVERTRRLEAIQAIKGPKVAMQELQKFDAAKGSHP